MDEQRERIVEDLSGDFRGEIRCDDLAVSMFASDASLFEIRPLGVAFPRDRDDVVTLSRYCTESRIPLTARGAGSNVTGSSLGAGLIVDFSRHMRSIEAMDASSVTVQPGMVLSRLNHLLKDVGRYFPPDPSNAAITTIGGMIGVDSAGSRAARVGSTRDHVVSLETVVPGGHVIQCGVERLDFPRSVEPGLEGDSDEQSAAANAKRTIVSRLAKLLGDHREVIREHQPTVMRNTSGYFLRGVLRHNELNLPRMLVGSEGTLGLFTSATLHTSPLPEFRGVALLVFGQMEQAIDAVMQITPLQPSACDLLDRRLLMLGRENDSRFERFIPATAEAGLLIEQTGFSELQARKRIQMAVAAVHDQCPDAEVAVEAYDFDGVEFLWELPRRVVSMLAQVKGNRRALPFTEDVAIPPPTLREFFVRVRAVLQKHDITASIYSHAASGQIHMRPFLPVPTPGDAPRLTQLATEINEITLSLGGSISGEHGDGLSRSSFVKTQFGPLYSVFREIKEIFDPHNLMSPGRIVTESTTLPGSMFRPVLSPRTDLVQLQLRWTPQELADCAETCNGCGGCRTQQEDERMCPFFRLDPSEEASPRSKANALRSLLSGRLGPTGTSTDEFRHLASLCFNCRQCELECPTNVRIPQMMIEAKAQAVEANGVDRATWTLARAHSLGGLASRAAWLSNWLLRSRTGRWLLEKSIGIDRRRKLPRFERRPLIDSLPEEFYTSAPAPREKAVVYFVDHFANYHDRELADAFLRVMKHNGIRVYVPDGQTGSGMAMVSAGDLQAARSMAEVNVRELADFAREDIPIVCTEPAAALCLRDDYPLLIDHPDVAAVSRQTIEAGAYLRDLHHAGHLRVDFQRLPLRVGYHTPCHLKSLKSGLPFRELLELIPELDVLSLEKGCSGMAGTFGLTREHYEESMAIGRPLMERMQQPDLVAGATECSSCRLQMEQNTDTPTIHPLKLLAVSYGLLPELRDRLLFRANR